ncbi:hypothetical protein C7C46_00595 [Streptomyces tateyamensis]|uniref:LamG-like jellyroll fold domain-containing protein n=1 Tax=Streptomyces tateyamensis TaxID=565073 RepID=A0A2V4PBG7_9ACTN|nr:LamG-like jellyroll fold domain-containing protein [Streptomyces tateyamensis]PYC88408.1 hypothetical protein C7C46_00595 [Streptomyces tateyamensis]
MQTNIRRRLSRWLGVWLALAAFLLPGGTPVSADTSSTSSAPEPVRVMTWNICGESGGSTPADPAYCPFRNDPQTKMAAVADEVVSRHLNTVLLQEICSGADGSQLALLQTALADRGQSDWNFATAESRRAPSPGDDDTGRCRGGLQGRLSIAVGVRNKITWTDQVKLPVDPAWGQDQNQILCVAAQGWEPRVCGTHLSNFGSSVPAVPGAQAKYDAEVLTVQKEVSAFGSVVLGGDFNTSVRSNLKPLYDRMAECDQQPFYPSDPVNETTHLGLDATAANTDPVTHALKSDRYLPTKIDYLFSTAGFSNCDSDTGQADTADYSYQDQPQCWDATHPLCKPNGFSDHTPLIGTVKNARVLSWGLGSASSLPDRTVVTGGVAFGPDHGGSAVLTGSAKGVVTASGPAVDTRNSFTVSAWAKTETTGVVLSQDGTNTSGMMLWYDGSEKAWHFAMPNSSGIGWHVDQTAAAADPGVWTHLTAVYDAVAQNIRLYVGGGSPTTAAHTARIPSSGPFVVGRDRVNGNENGYLTGSVQQVQVFEYPMTDAEVGALHGTLAAPTATTTAPLSDTTDAGCWDIPTDFPLLPTQTAQPGHPLYGIVHTTTPSLSVQVAGPDPSAPVHAVFTVWDDSHPAQQNLPDGQSGSPASALGGQSTLALSLQDGHTYGWYARTSDGTSSSPSTTPCHFTVKAQ